MKDVEDAIILAGGRGTRMLPGSIFVPKEIMPLVDTPLINHLIWEASRAGVKRIHIVVSSSKKDIISEALLEDKTWEDQIRPDLPRISLQPVPGDVNILLHEQVEPGGVGDAISIVAKLIKGPFLVILGDNLLIKNHIGPEKSGIEFASGASKKLVDYYHKTGIACCGISEVDIEEVSKYGIVKINGELIEEIVEKPKPENAPSRYVLCGRYLLPEKTGELLDTYTSSEYGELQSIALFNHFIKNEGFGGVDLKNYVLYDSGDPLNWLKSQIDHALRREDLNRDLRDWIKSKIVDKNS
jgi:UTP--glucose-1-phosphate uridylyltransferase